MTTQEKIAKADELAHDLIEAQSGSNAKKTAEELHALIHDIATECNAHVEQHQDQKIRIAYGNELLRKTDHRSISEPKVIPASQETPEPSFEAWKPTREQLVEGCKLLSNVINRMQGREDGASSLEQEIAAASWVQTYAEDFGSFQNAAMVIAARHVACESAYRLRAEGEYERGVREAAKALRKRIERLALENGGPADETNTVELPDWVEDVIAELEGAEEIVLSVLPTPPAASKPEEE